LKVNFYKSHVSNIGLSVEDSAVFTKCLNSRQMDVPFKYLGMTIGGNPKRVAFWKPIIDKIKAKLSNWKGKILSMAGKICLIKSVIIALLLFYLSFFKASSKVCSLIKKIQTKFLWGWGYEERKIAWLVWDKVCSPIEMGGLGIREIGRFNVAFLTKWKWRTGVDDGGVWRDILESTYGSWRDMRVTMEDKKSYFWWRDLSKICHDGNETNWFDNRIRWKLGNGKRIRLWEDKWIGELPLIQEFPRLKLLSLNADSVVCEVVERVNNGNEEVIKWNLC